MSPDLYVEVHRRIQGLRRFCSFTQLGNLATFTVFDQTKGRYGLQAASVALCLNSLNASWHKKPFLRAIPSTVCTSPSNLVATCGTQGSGSICI